ncbi:MAG: hypothetical protein KQH63_21090 [Desulfobulbaceae bacterium]|nr:hypothetical protein [Desulfobulbaceae bacterium]
MEIIPLKMDCKTKSKVETKKVEKIEAEQVVAGSTILLVGAAPVLIGLWAAVCFVGGVAVSGGPWNLIQNWLSAVTGM